MSSKSRPGHPVAAIDDIVGDEVASIGGEQFAVTIAPRQAGDPHLCVQLWSEDDEAWFPLGNSFSSHWVDDLIDVLRRSTRWCEQNAAPDPVGGWKK